MEQQLRVKLTSVSPLLMHNGRGANPLDEMTKKHRALTAKKGKTDADHEEIIRSEWEVSIHHSESAGPFLPASYIEGSVKAAAKLEKLGKAFGQAVMVIEDQVPLQYKGPRDLDGMFKAKFYDVRGVKNPGSQARIMRCRPKFNSWTCEFSLNYDDEIVNRDSVVRAVQAAGKRAGLGDYRPEKGGRFGKFTAEIL